MQPQISVLCFFGIDMRALFSVAPCEMCTEVQLEKRTQLCQLVIVQVIDAVT